jgi:hypothetical protein
MADAAVADRRRGPARGGPDRAMDGSAHEALTWWVSPLDFLRGQRNSLFY